MVSRFKKKRVPLGYQGVVQLLAFWEFMPGAQNDDIIINARVMAAKVTAISLCSDGRWRSVMKGKVP